MKTRCVMKANILDKEIVVDGNPVAVYGLASMNVAPKGRGLGRWCLRGFEEMARKDNKYAVVGFCTDDVVGFYIACGWFNCGAYGGKNIVASKNLSNPVVNELW